MILLALLILLPYLKNQISTIFENFNLTASMGRLRTIQVLVVGEARVSNGGANQAEANPVPSLRDLNVGDDIRVAALLVARIDCSRRVAVGRAIADLVIGVQRAPVQGRVDLRERSASRVGIDSAIDVVAGNVRRRARVPRESNVVGRAGRGRARARQSLCCGRSLGIARKI